LQADNKMVVTANKMKSFRFISIPFFTYSDIKSFVQVPKNAV